MFRKALTLATALICMTAVAQGQQIITYTFEGVVTRAPISSPPYPTLYSNLAVGDAMRSTFRVNADAQLHSPMPNPFGSNGYSNAVTGFHLELGGATTEALEHSIITIWDDVPSSSMCRDSLLLSTNGHDINNGCSPAPDYLEFSISLSTLGGCPSPAIPSFELPRSLSLEDFPQAGFTMYPPNFYLQGLCFHLYDDLAGEMTSISVAITADHCSDAVALPSTFATSLFDATFATTDGADAAGFCDYGPLGDDQNYNDIWFTYTPDVGGCTYISTRGLTGYDTRIAVYDDASCPDDPASIIACADNEDFPAAAPFEAGLDVNLIAGETYLIRVGTSDAAILGGEGAITIAAGPGADVNSLGMNPGAPGCVGFNEFCNGDGGVAPGCTDCPCANNASTNGGCLNSAGSAARLIATGSASVSLATSDASDLRFALSGAPARTLCILNSGDNLAPTNTANPCFGANSGAQSAAFDGLRCATQNTRRHGTRPSDTEGRVGATSNPWGGEAGPPAGIANAGGSFVAGQTRYFQVIYRDDPLLACMRGLNTSQAVQVTFEP